MEFKPYFYYSKNDSKKEPIDKVLTLDEKNALTYFANRKNMDEKTFINIYTIEIYEETKSK
jgi:hypothetical protein